MKCYLKYLWVFLPFLCLNNIQAQTSSYTDPIYKQWVELFVKHDYESLLASIEKNLEKDTPHPKASFAWLKVHEYADDVNESYDKLPPKLKEKLKILIELYNMNPREINDAFPISRVKEIDDWAILYYLDLNVNRSIDKNYFYELVKHSMLQSPESFNFYWNLKYESVNVPIIYHRIRKEIEEGEFDSSPNFVAFANEYFFKLPVDRYAAIAYIDSFWILSIMKLQKKLISEPLT